VSRWLATYAVVQVLGLLALPLAWSICRTLPDRGTALAKPLGLLLTGLVLWLGVSHGLLRNDLGGAVLAAALLGVASFRAGRTGLARDSSGRWPLVSWLRRERALLVAEEVVFLAAFALWSLVRAHDPAADHTEQPMDLMLVTASAVSPTLPLPDPWLAGQAVGYYYFGHWLVALVGRLAGQPPETAYTVGQAAWYGMLALGSFALVANLLRLDPTARPRRAMAGGLLAIVIVVLAGNLQGTLDTLQRAGLDLSSLAAGHVRHNFTPPSEQWWWWRSSRVLMDHAADGTPLEVIDEVPAFSYVLGDLHPHLLAQPFVLVALGLCLARFLGSARPRAVEAAVLTAVVAGVAFVNPADLPPVALFAVAAVWGAGRREGRGTVAALAAGGALVAGVALLLWPFLLAAQGQVEGLLPNALHPTPLWQLALMFGSLAPGIAWVVGRPPRGDLWKVALGVALAVLLAALAVTVVVAAAGDDRPLASSRWTRDPWTLLAVSALCGALAARLLAEGGSPARRAVLLAALVGCGLVLAPELVYLHDGFGTRMNTVFKLYYQAWLLLGLAGAVALSGAWNAASRAGRWGARLGAALAGSGIVFTAAAAWDVTRGFAAPPSFDALATVGADERAAIAWVRTHVPGDALVLQAAGHSYQAEESRLSVATGRPTVLGWDGHELQWRGREYEAMAAGRAAAVEVVYRAADPEALRQALDTWRIGYVFVGPAERRLYGIDAAVEERLLAALDVAFEQGDARVYRRRAIE
jgi:YYY domain-containing protein